MEWVAQQLVSASVGALTAGACMVFAFTRRLDRIEYSMKAEHRHIAFRLLHIEKGLHISQMENDDAR